MSNMEPEVIAAAAQVEADARIKLWRKRLFILLGLVHVGLWRLLSARKFKDNRGSA